MKKIITFITVIILISCSKDSLDNEDNVEGAKFNYKVIGKYYDLTVNGGTESRELYSYESVNGNHDFSNYSNLHEEFGAIPDLNYDFFGDSEGVTIRVIDRRDNYFYYKNFATGEVSNIMMPYVDPSYWTYIHYNNLIYFFYREYGSYSEDDGTMEYNLNILNSITGQISKHTLGRFKSQGYNKFELRQKGKLIYFLYKQDNRDVNSEQHFIIFDLEELEILDSKSDFKPDLYNMVLDQSGDCYFFGRQYFSKYSFSNKSLSDINIPGSTYLLSEIFPSAGSPSIIIDNKIYFGLGGPQPGPGAVYPSIYDLNSGEMISISIYDQISQFDDDIVGWNPLAKCFALDYENKVFLIGVESANIGGEAKSQGVFTVDFEGKILNKQKIPILPRQIIN